MPMPPIKANMSPPANFWDGDTFKMPGVEARVQEMQQGQGPQNPFNQPSNDWAGYLRANPDVQAAYDQNIGNVQSRYSTPELYAQQFHYPQYGRNENRSFGTPAAPQTPAQQPQPYMGGMPSNFAGGGMMSPGNAPRIGMMQNPFLQGLM